MKARGNIMKKAQSIVEYLTILTAITVVICAYTFAHFSGNQPGQIPGKNLLGVNSALNNIQDELDDIVHDDYAGEPIDWTEPVVPESTLGTP